MLATLHASSSIRSYLITMTITTMTSNDAVLPEHTHSHQIVSRITLTPQQVRTHGCLIINPFLPRVPKCGDNNCGIRIEFRKAKVKTIIYVRLRGLAYIRTCRSYIHTPRDFTNDASPAWRLRRRISTVMFTSWWAWPSRWPIRPIWGFWGSKFHQNVRFSAWDEPPCKMWRR